jgi:hypothetical protein
MAGRLDDIAAARLARHLDTCDDCRAESSLMAGLRVPVPVPAGLEERVLRTLRAGSGQAPVRLRRLPAARHLAMAATVVFALVTASLLRNSSPVDEPIAPEPQDPGGMLWSAYQDPLLPGSADLHALSVAELELVLKELER